MPTDPFACEACGHPMNLHNPCTATVGKGKRAKPCRCQRFEPEDRRLRMAALTDTADVTPPPLHKVLEALR